jgi:hypothetical protein
MAGWHQEATVCPRSAQRTQSTNRRTGVVPGLDRVGLVLLTQRWRWPVMAHRPGTGRRWLSKFWKHNQATALFASAVLATLYVFRGPGWFETIVASLVIAVSLFWLRKMARGIYFAIEVVIGLIAIWDASGKGRGDFSSDFSSSDFAVYQWSVILLQTAAAIYLEPISKLRAGVDPL